ncbi:hypothetical protein ACGF12_35835 [Kitasatospora sp. NPDC048296]|uniref:hypothetical protein n=1 Tax=Kitasatospora sp. NPDC048296 TaxID=3364048 RepID=UPI003714625B
MDTGLSGNLMRSAHYERYTSVGPVSRMHTEQQPGRGMFEPTPEANVAPNPGDMWAPRDVTPHTDALVRTAGHGESSMAAPVPSGVPETLGDRAAQARLIEAHAHQAYTPEQYPRPISNGRRDVVWTEGRAPIQPNMEAFLTGPNGYDFSNPPSEVYGGERYRLGTDTHYFGHYEYWTKQGQDAWLRPVTTEYPILPVDKPQIADPAPYTSPSVGTQRWRLPSFQDPRMFTAPSETGMSDFAMAQQQSGPVAAEFDDGGRL